MITLIIFQTGEDGLKFYAIEGNKTHLQDIFINSASDNRKYQEELGSLIYDYEGYPRQESYSLDEWVKLVRTTPFPVITCGELP